MKEDTKQRLKIFGAGASIGVVLSILLFQYADYVEGPRRTTKVEVVLTTCDLKAGDVFEEECVEKRAVAEQFIPPDTIESKQLGLYVGEPVIVDLEKGSAVRTVDFAEEK